MTLLVYAALSGMFFFLVLQLQVSGGYSPLEAGAGHRPGQHPDAAAVRAGGRAGRPARGAADDRDRAGVCAAGTAVLSTIGRHPAYLTQVLPGIVLFGLGMCTLVAPLTGTVLAAAPDRYAGTASGINNAVSRTGGLLAIAALPVLVGLSGDGYADPARLTPAFQRAMYICVGLTLAGSLAAFVGISRVGRPATGCGAVRLTRGHLSARDDDGRCASLPSPRSSR